MTSQTIEAAEHAIRELKKALKVLEDGGYDVGATAIRNRIWHYEDVLRRVQGENR